MKLNKLATEQRNQASMHIDEVSTLEMVEIINQEDLKVALAVQMQLKQIAKAIDLASSKFRDGGRLIYIGAGTSGRLGALDAIELTPTYSVSPERAFGILAGGKEAMFSAIEGAEDSEELAIRDLRNINFCSKDILIAIAASGRTPYSFGAMEYANQMSALTISLTCTENNKMSEIAQIPIEVIVGPEVITGSTRMKAGTAQKMVLNMLSTGIMIKTGKVYQNLMINVQATNQKLERRAVNIVSEALAIDEVKAEKLLRKADNHINVAITMAKYHLDKNAAQDYLEKNDGRIAGGFM